MFAFWFPKANFGRFIDGFLEQRSNWSLTFGFFYSFLGGLGPDFGCFFLIEKAAFIFMLWSVKQDAPLITLVSRISKQSTCFVMHNWGGASVRRVDASMSLCGIICAWILCLWLSENGLYKRLVKAPNLSYTFQYHHFHELPASVWHLYQLLR